MWHPQPPQKIGITGLNHFNLAAYGLQSPCLRLTYAVTDAGSRLGMEYVGSTLLQSHFQRLATRRLVAHHILPSSSRYVYRGRSIVLWTYWPIDLLTHKSINPWIYWHYRIKWYQNGTKMVPFFQKLRQNSKFRACFSSFQYLFVFAKTLWTLYIQTFNSFQHDVKIFGSTGAKALTFWPKSDAEYRDKKLKTKCSTV